jgi:hypothetical protein
VSFTDERGHYVQTRRGGRFHLTNPTAEEVDIGDVAHALSLLCRFGGQLERFYSVAQHCVLVSRDVPAELAMDGLLHDASEAYVGDMSSPLKAALRETGSMGYDVVEELAHRAIARRYGTRYPHDPRVKEADLRALATEARDLMAPGEPETWGGLPAPMEGRIWPLGPAEAEAEFLDRFREVDEGR